MNSSWNDQFEWLETDGLGGFASGTAGGIRTRRYHGLLLTATNPPTGRYMLVNGVEVLVTTSAGTFGLSSQRYDGEVVSPEGFKYIEAFDVEPWPTWRFKLPDGTVIEQELFLQNGQPITAMSWRLVKSTGPVKLHIRPLLAGRDYHALHHENADFNFTADKRPGQVQWKPYPTVPSITVYTNGRYAHEPTWYRKFFYQDEWLRGFDATEDLAAPGIFEFDPSVEEAVMIFAAEAAAPLNMRIGSTAERMAELRDSELKRRNAFASPLHRAADQYVVRRGEGKTIIAGYPWFADWGRDTFISLRGLCLATDRLEDARQILVAWSKHVSIGMLPNRFPDSGEEPEFNSVDASLWYVVAVCEFLRTAANQPVHVSDFTRKALLGAVDQILNGYMNGTRHGIHMDSDGLLLAGERGQQLTWMDARVGEFVVTPRMGKPVEVQALWLNALHLASTYDSKWHDIGEKGAMSFRAKFWNEQGQYLYDVVDHDLQPGQLDASFRPNQIYAIGGLPLMLIDKYQATAVLDQIEKRLFTRLGLRSLASDQHGYCPQYTGGPGQRDGAYHQGTVWPFLMGPFIEAWVRIRGDTSAAKREARQKFLEPLLKHLNEAGLGHVSEIADASAPHMPRGCPFQAWSLGELLRIDQIVLAEPATNLAASNRHPTFVH